MMEKKKAVWWEKGARLNDRHHTHNNTAVQLINKMSTLRKL